MKSLWSFIFCVLLSFVAQAAPFPSAKDICLANVEQTFALIISCNWDIPGTDPVFNQYKVGDDYMCNGRLVCGNIDPYLAGKPYELKMTKCNNGPTPCTTFTSQCKTTMKQKEIQLCNNLTPDSHHYEPAPPLHPPYPTSGP